MKIVNKEVIKLENPVPVYDILNANPHNNFILSSGVVSHNCALMDELEFMRGSNVDYLESGVMRLYRGVKSRMKSRFVKAGGGIPGMLFLVSSKKSEHDFLEQYIRKNITPSTIVVDEPQWVVRGEDKYCGRKFKVAVGSKYIKSRIVGDSDNVEDLERQGYDILEVPIEFEEDFRLSVDAALMDIAGIAVSSTSKFFDYDRVKDSMSDRLNPFGVEILTIGLDDQEEYSDYFDKSKVQREDMYRPGFIHIDTSLTGDMTGISYVTISGRAEIRRYTQEATSDGSHVVDATDLTYNHVFTIYIKAPPSSQISLAKNRQFVYWLKANGFNIKGVSLDGFQSADTLQALTTAGYEAKLRSLDRTPDGYLMTRSAIYEGRLSLLNISRARLEDEFLDVERTPKGKIDHSQEGSKDGLDSLVGATWNASQYKHSNYYRYAMSDTAATTELYEEGNTTEELTDQMFGGMGQVVSDLNELAGYAGGDGIIDLFSEL